MNFRRRFAIPLVVLLGACGEGANGELVDEGADPADTGSGSRDASFVDLNTDARPAANDATSAADSSVADADEPADADDPVDATLPTDASSVVDATVPLDAGPRDAGILDAGPRDAGPLDAGPRDAGIADAGPRDAGAPDAGNPNDPGPKPNQVCNPAAINSPGWQTHLKNMTVPNGTNYTIHIPSNYNGTQALPLVIGFHGCGDTAQNYASWGLASAENYQNLKHFSVSVGGKDGQCWDPVADAPKAAAVLAHVKSCYWVHQKKVTISGYSSGGILAYNVGLQNANTYAGILIENSAIGATRAARIAGAARKIPIAHRHAVDDSSFPIAGVRADWAAFAAAGFPMTTSERPAGLGHEGSKDDWTTYLLPKVGVWQAP